MCDFGLNAVEEAVRARSFDLSEYRRGKYDTEYEEYALELAGREDAYYDGDHLELGKARQCVLYMRVTQSSIAALFDDLKGSLNIAVVDTLSTFTVGALTGEEMCMLRRRVDACITRVCPSFPFRCFRTNVILQVKRIVKVHDESDVNAFYCNAVKDETVVIAFSIFWVCQTYNSDKRRFESCHRGTQSVDKHLHPCLYTVLPLLIWNRT